MKSNKSAMVCAKLIALTLWGVVVLGVVSSPLEAQTPKQVPPIKNLCMARRSASSCRSANLVGNFDGSGQTDYAVWRPSIGTWFVLSSSDPSKFFVQAWGVSGDIPVPGDYDGDGITDYAVWRPSTGTWFIIPSGNPSQPIIQQWGASGDIPVPGDYDGDGTTDIAVWRPSNGIWYVIPSSNPTTYIVQQWGTNGDIPVPGVYDDGGQTDYAVWRPSTGTWFVYRASTRANSSSSSGERPEIRPWWVISTEMATRILPSGGLPAVLGSSSPAACRASRSCSNGERPEISLSRATTTETAPRILPSGDLRVGFGGLFLHRHPRPSWRHSGGSPTICRLWIPLRQLRRAIR